MLAMGRAAVLWCHGVSGCGSGCCSLVFSDVMGFLAVDQAAVL